MNWVRRTALLATLLVAACGLPAATASEAREADTRAILTDLIAGRDDAVRARLEISDPTVDTGAQMRHLRTLFPPGGLPEGETVGWQANAGTGGQTYDLARHYDYPDRLVDVDLAFVKRGEDWKVLSLDVDVTLKNPAEGVIAPQSR